MFGLTSTGFDGFEMSGYAMEFNDPMGFHSPNLLEDGYDIRTIQEFWVHKDVATTMTYTTC